MNKSISSIFVFGLLLTMLVPFAMMDAYAVVPNTMYGGVSRGSPADPGAIVTIDQLNGAQTIIADDVNPDGLSGLAFDSTDRLFGTVVSGPSPTSTLVEFNPNTGLVINTIGSIVDAAGTSIKIIDLSFQPGTDTLYGANIKGGTSVDVYTINTSTAVATFVGSNTQIHAIAFCPDGTFYGIDTTLGAENIKTLNPADASTILTTVLTNDYDALGCRSDGVLYAARGGTGDGAAIHTVNIAGTETFIGTDQRFIGDLDFTSDISIGGIFVPIDTTALLLAGVQSISMWMIPVILAGIGIGVFVIKKRN